MRRVRVRTVADMEALPEGEWVEVPDGVPLRVTREGVRLVDGRIVVTLPKPLAIKFRAPVELTARIWRGKLIVEKRPSRRRRRDA